MPGRGQPDGQDHPEDRITRSPVLAVSQLTVTHHEKTSTLERNLLHPWCVNPSNSQFAPLDSNPEAVVSTARTASNFAPLSPGHGPVVDGGRAAPGLGVVERPALGAAVDSAGDRGLPPLLLGGPAVDRRSLYPAGEFALRNWDERTDSPVCVVVLHAEAGESVLPVIALEEMHDR